MSRDDRPVVHVAVGVVRGADGRVLIARRPEHAHQGGLLEFPGGKVEPSESVQQALCRELKEETGINVRPGTMNPLIVIRHDYGDKVVLLDVWQVTGALGEPVGREGQPVFWLRPGDLVPADFPVANYPIIAAIRLPAELAITGGAGDLVATIEKYRRALERCSPELVVARFPSLSFEDYRQVVAAMVDVSDRGSPPGLLVHDYPELVTELPVAGVHLSWRRAALLSSRPVGEGYWFGVSCHDARELAHAAAIGADYATLGPVLPTPSHPGAQGIGWETFAALVDNAALPVYALGGITPGARARAQAAGGQGIAGISYWWHETTL